MSRLTLGAPAFDVPANASRFFSSSEEAQQQPEARIELSVHEEFGFIFNAAFDPTLIAHGAAYCTSVVDLDLQVQLPTLDYFESRALAAIGDGSRVLDVGCGQGEFVRALRSRGVDAVGFDPVLRAPNEF